MATQPKETHMATGGTGRRTITVVTTTWMIRWWDGEQWIKQTLEPSVEVVSDGEGASSEEAAMRAAASEVQEPIEPTQETETDQTEQGE
jgi:hypothetical protein